MANFADSTDIATLRTALAGYVTSITHDDSDTQTILRAKAQLALDRYADAEGAVNTLNAAANQSYSNGLGFSVNKKRLDDAKAAASAAWDGFVRVWLCRNLMPRQHILAGAQMLGRISPPCGLTSRTTRRTSVPANRAIDPLARSDTRAVPPDVQEAQRSNRLTTETNIAL